jgi:hypothetical protein
MDLSVLTIKESISSRPVPNNGWFLVPRYNGGSPVLHECGCEYRTGYGGTLILNILGYGYGNIYNIFLNKNKYIIHKK